jgi:hypothetical protein
LGEHGSGELLIPGLRPALCLRKHPARRRKRCRHDQDIDPRQTHRHLQHKQETNNDVEQSEHDVNECLVCSIQSVPVRRGGIANRSGQRVIDVDRKLAPPQGCVHQDRANKQPRHEFAE